MITTRTKGDEDDVWMDTITLIRSIKSLTLKSIPTVDMKLPDKNVPSRNLTSRHVFPTPESPSSITFVRSIEGWTQHTQGSGNKSAETDLLTTNPIPLPSCQPSIMPSTSKMSHPRSEYLCCEDGQRSQ